DLQGHPGREVSRRLQRSHHRSPRRAEDRREADQSGPVALGRRANQLEPAARDLCRRCEVHAWSGSGPAGCRSDVLPAGTRADPGRRADHAAARVRRRGPRWIEDSRVADANRVGALRDVGSGPGRTAMTPTTLTAGTDLTTVRADFPILS